MADKNSFLRGQTQNTPSTYKQWSKKNKKYQKKTSNNTVQTGEKRTSMTAKDYAARERQQEIDRQRHQEALKRGEALRKQREQEAQKEAANRFGTAMTGLWKDKAQQDQVKTGSTYKTYAEKMQADAAGMSYQEKREKKRSNENPLDKQISESTKNWRENTAHLEHAGAAGLSYAQKMMIDTPVRDVTQKPRTANIKDSAGQAYAEKMMRDTPVKYETQAPRVANVNDSNARWDRFLEENGIKKRQYSTEQAVQAARTLGKGHAGYDVKKGEIGKMTVPNYTAYNEQLWAAKDSGLNDEGYNPWVMTEEGRKRNIPIYKQRAEEADQQAQTMWDDYRLNVEKSSPYLVWGKVFDMTEQMAPTGHGLARKQQATEKAKDFFLNEYDQEQWTVDWNSGDEFRQAMRRRIYDKIMPDTYDQRTAMMTPEQKAELDRLIDDAVETANNMPTMQWYERDEKNQQYRLIADEYRDRAKEAETAQASMEKVRIMQEQLGNSVPNTLYRSDYVKTHDAELDKYQITVKEPEGSRVDKAYYWMNNKPTADEMIKSTEIRREYFATQEMTDTFTSFYNYDKEHGTNMAGQFLDAIQPYLDSCYAEWFDYSIREQAEDPVSGIPFRIATYPINVIGGMAGLIGTGLGIAGNKDAQSTNSKWYNISKAVQAVREEQNEDASEAVARYFATDKYGNVNKKAYDRWRQGTRFLLNTADSIGDNLVAMGTAKGLTGDLRSKAGMRIVQLIMSGEATANTMYQKLDEGKSPTEAAIYAIGDGIIEWITERISLEAILSPSAKEFLGGANLKEKLWNAAKFGLKARAAEGSEEIAADLLNWGLDEILSFAFKHQTELQKRAGQMIIDEGIPADEAYKQALIEKWEQIGMSGAAGWISGGVLSNMRYASNAIQQTKTGAKISSESNTDLGVTGQQRVVDLGKAMAEGSMSRETAEVLQKKLDAGKKLSNNEVGRLAQQIALETSEEQAKIATNTLTMLIKAQLAEAGVKSQETGYYAEIIARSMTSSEGLSAADRMKLAQNENAIQLWKTYNSNTAEGSFMRTVAGMEIAGQTEAQRSVMDTLSGLTGEFVPGRSIMSAEVDEARKNTKTDAEALDYLYEKNKNIISEEFLAKAKELLDSDEKAKTSKTFVDDVMKVMWAAKTMSDTIPNTNLSEETAKALFEQAKAEFEEEYKLRITNGQVKVVPGRGQVDAVDSDGKAIEYGSTEWEEWKQSYNKEIRNHIGAVTLIARQFGHTVHFIDDPKRNMVNGWQNAADGSIVINVAQGMKHSMMATIVHEMTHWLEQNSITEYRKLNQFIVDSLRKKGSNVEALLKSAIDNQHRVRLMEEDAGLESTITDLSIVDAMRELVAKSCEGILNSREMQEAIAQADPGLFNTIKRFVRNVIARINNALENTTGKASLESQLLIDVRDELAHLWLGGRTEALDRQAKGETEAAPATESKEYSVIEDEDTLKLLAADAQRHINEDYEAERMIMDKYGISETDVQFGVQFTDDGKVDWAAHTDEEKKLIRKISKTDQRRLYDLKKDANKWIAVQYQRWNGGEFEYEDYLDDTVRFGRDEIGNFRNFIEKAKAVKDGYGDLKWQSGKEIYHAEAKNYGPFRKVNKDFYNPDETILDNEYEEAVENGNMARAEELLLEKLARTQGITPYRATHAYAGKYHDIAKLIKTKYGEAIATAAESMANEIAKIPADVVLVPMPPSSGEVTTDTDTWQLAHAISLLTGDQVVVALTSEPRESRFKAKQANKAGVKAEEMGFRQIADIPDGKMPVFIDNVVGKGETAKAAHNAIGYGITLAYAKSTRGKATTGLKNLSVTYDKNGNLIPLSQRLDVNNPNPNYSVENMDVAQLDIKELNNRYMDAVKANDKETMRLLVNEAARRGGYTIRAYHGTNAKFTQFKGGNRDEMWFASTPETAYERKYNYDTYLKINNPYEETDFIGVESEFNPSLVTEKGRSNGHDGGIVHFKLNPDYVYDSLKIMTKYGMELPATDPFGDNFTYMPKGKDRDNLAKPGETMADFMKRGAEETLYDWYVVYNPEQIKSADLVVYDDNGDIIPLSERFNVKNKDMRYSIEQLDDEYSAALAANDTETMKRIIMEAARQAGYTIAAYHGTSSTFTSFDKKYLGRATGAATAKIGFFLTDNKEIAGKFSKISSDPIKRAFGIPNQTANVMNLLVKIDNPYVYETKEGNSFDLLRQDLHKSAMEYTKGWAVPVQKGTKLNNLPPAVQRDIGKYFANELIKDGYDGIIIKQTTMDGRTPHDFYIVFNPKQIKSAEPVTYDDAGNPIMPSERFDDTTPERKNDTRYSVEETKDLLAVHNLTEEQLLKSLEEGGFPAPSIAVFRAATGHSLYGEISVIFRKDTIDPNIDIRNRIYGQDAWTPTRSQAKVETQIDYKTAFDIERKLTAKMKGMPESLVSEVHRWIYEKSYTGYTRDSIEGLGRSAYTSMGMLAAYMKDHGMPVTLNYRKVLNLPESKIDTYEAFLNLLDKYGETEEFRKDFLSDKWIGRLDEALEKGHRLKQTIERAKEGKEYAKELLQATIKAAYKYDSEGRSENAKTVLDEYNTKTMMQHSIKLSDFVQWIKDTFGPAMKEKGIYNGEDRYTEDGTERSWKETHMPVTLENIVKAMYRNGERKGGYAGHATGLMAKASKEYKSIDEVRQDKKRMRLLQGDDYELEVHKLDKRLDDFTKRLAHISGLPEDEARKLVIAAAEEYARWNGSMNDVWDYMRDRGVRLPVEARRELEKLYKQAQEIPSGYFEAKPMRVVGTNEIAKVLITDNTSDILKNKLDELGIPYEKHNGSDEQRTEKMKQLQDLMFSVEQLQDDYKAALAANDKETMKRIVLEYGAKKGWSIHAYHGTPVGYMVGNTFDPNKATSGPMAYFTDDYDLAENYSKEKKVPEGVSEEAEILFDGLEPDVAWDNLEDYEKKYYMKQARHIKIVNDTPVFDEKYRNKDFDPDEVDYLYHGNLLQYLVDEYYDFGNETDEKIKAERFKKLLTDMDFDDVEVNPGRDPKVYDVLLNIQNPFETETMYDYMFVTYLEGWWRRQNPDIYDRELAREEGATIGDKHYKSMEMWLDQAYRETDPKSTWENNAFVWTTIPDAVTDYLKERGFDGIKDFSGKHTGDHHAVWIPFDSDQVKSAEPVTYHDDGTPIMLEERFDNTTLERKNNINYSVEAGEDPITVPNSKGEPMFTILPGNTIAATEYSLSSYYDLHERDNMIKAMTKAGYTEERIKHYIEQLDNLALKIASNRLMYDFVADRNLKFMKPNGDFYKKTMDANTMCQHTRLYNGTYNLVQHMLPNTTLMPSDLVDLYNLMKDMNLETPCKFCYVQSRRRNIGPYAERWLAEYKGAYKPRMEELTTSDGLMKLKNEHKKTYEDFVKAMNKMGVNNPKLVQERTDYRGEIRKMRKSTINYLNEIGGLRFQSFTDFELVHALDMMQIIMDMNIMGLKGQAYTKVSAFAWIFGPTGLKINLSVTGKDSGLDAEGNLIFDDTEGFDHKEAQDLRALYDKNIGTIIVGINDDHIIACMGSDLIDLIIPFHKSGWGKAERQGMRGMEYYQDYTDEQNEYDIQYDWRGRPKKDKDGNIIKVKAKSNIAPSSYWEYDKDGEYNAKKYLKYCEDHHIVPKFARFLESKGDGKYQLPTGEDTRSKNIRKGYWKTLVDFRMYDKNGNGAEQQIVTPEFNNSRLMDYMDAYKGTHRALPENWDAAERFVKMFKEKHPLNAQRLTYSVEQSPDMDVERFMMGLNEHHMNTVQEQIMLRQFKELRGHLDVLRHILDERAKEIKAIEDNPKKNALDVKRLMTLKSNQNRDEAKYEAERKELVRITKDKGYAKLMKDTAQTMTNLVTGKTADEMQDAVTAMNRQIDEVTKEMADRAEHLKDLAKKEAVLKIRALFNRAGLKQIAAKLKAEMASTLDNETIENNLALIALKMKQGRVTEDSMMELADLLVGGMEKHFDGYTINMLRGRTLVLGKVAMKELRDSHRTVTEIKRDLVGTGIRVSTKGNTTLDEIWDDMCKMFTDLDPNEPVGNQLDILLNKIKAEIRESQKEYSDSETQKNIIGKIAVAAAELLPDIVADKKSLEMLKETLDFVHAISAEAKETAGMMEDVNVLMERIKKAGKAAAAKTESLTGDVKVALNYFDELGKQSEAARWKSERYKLIAELKTENAQNIIAEQEKWKERIQRDKTARDQMKSNMMLRKAVHINFTRLKNLLVNETDQKHIPEHMKSLVRYTLNMIADNDLTGRKITGHDPKDLAELKRVLTTMDVLDPTFTINDLLQMHDPEAQAAVADALADLEDGIREYNTKPTKKLLPNLQHFHDSLEKISEAVSTIKGVINAQRNIDFFERRMEVGKLATTIRADMKNSKFTGELKGRGSGAIRTVNRAVVYGNTTPVYYFKGLKNRGMDMLWDEFAGSENRNGLEIQKAQAFIAGLAQRTGYRNWAEEKHEVILGGRKMTITVDNMMELYAIWKREKTLNPEMSNHLEKGGVFIQEKEEREGKLRREKTEQRATRVTDDEIMAIYSKLTDAQREYLTSIVEYLSKDMSDLGNEASMRMYGIKKYKETWYFPMKVWDGVKSARSDRGISGVDENRAAHKSWSKRRKHLASNALVIGSFTQDAVNHIVEMINYNTMAPAIENMNKILNYQFIEDEGTDAETKRNMRVLFQQNYGLESLKYLEQFMKDLNGGLVQDQRKTLADIALTLFKKNAVAGSLSVTAQQPLSYIRAAMMINPKYMAEALNPKYYKGSWKEMLEHSGVAVIKEMGRFDMNFGRSAKDWIAPETNKSAYEKVGDAVTTLPQMADRMTWTRMWTAVKLEQQALHPEMDPKSKAFLDMAGERFNDVMRRTQVYDSVLVKSSNMRSTNYGLKLITSFMAEPTLSLNVLADAVRNAKEKGGVENVAKAAATFLLSAVMQAVVKGLMASGRSPDEKKTWLENFLNKFQYNLQNEANVFSLIPGYSRLIELLKTGKLQDDAMGVLGKIFTSGQVLKDFIAGNRSDYYRIVEDTVGQVTQLFTNIPAKNLMRDARAIYNWAAPGTYANRPTSGAVIKQQAIANLWNGDDLLGTINTWLDEAGFRTTQTAYYNRMYNSMKNGDRKGAAEIKEYLMLGKGVTEKAIDTGVKKAAKADGSMSESQRASWMINEGMMDKASDVATLYKERKVTRSEAEKLMKQMDPKLTADEIYWKLDVADYKVETGNNDASGYYYRLVDAVNANSSTQIQTAVKNLLAHGITKEKIKDRLSDWKKEYLAADANKRRKIRDALEKAYKAAGYTVQDADKTIERWTKEQTK